MKNQVIEGKVIDYTHDGKGIVKYDGYPFFIKGTIIDEFIKFKVVKWKKKYGFGRLLEVIETNDKRVETLCPVYKKCGGCQIQHASEQEQLNFKKKKVENAFKKQDIIFNQINIIENTEKFKYRNKLSTPLAYDGRVYAGLYQENSNIIVEIEDCLIQKDIINVILAEVVKCLNKYNISIYNKELFKGYLRQIVIRCTQTNKILLGFVVNDCKYDRSLDMVIDDLKSHNAIESIVINFNTEKNNVILGKNNQIVYGTGYVIDEINSLKFRISVNSFYQVNTLQMNLLYKKAIELANLNKSDVVLDAYCGVGTISIYLASIVKRVVGVDVVDAAIKDANVNRELNMIDNIDFICSDVREYMKNHIEQFDCVFLDPPRKGCSNEFLEDLLNIAPRKIIYISCDVATQARDVKLLIESGYKIINQCAVDMFSQTYHVENILYLEKI